MIGVTKKHSRNQWSCLSGHEFVQRSGGISGPRGILKDKRWPLLASKLLSKTACTPFETHVFQQPTTEIAPKQDSGAKPTPKHPQHNTPTETHTHTHLRRRNISWTPLFQRTQNERAQETTAKCKLRSTQHKEQCNPQE